MGKSNLDLSYICNHILHTIHTQIRQYKLTEGDGPVLLQYYGDSFLEDAVSADKDWVKEIMSGGPKDYPVMYMEKYPVYYALIYCRPFCFLAGPVNIEQQQVYYEGVTVEDYLARKHQIKSLKIPYCKYKNFCQEVLLLFYAATGKEMSYKELNERNYISKALLASMEAKKSRTFFSYQEHARVHNPYRHEARMMDAIRKGDVERVKKCLEETFTGEYGVLSKNSLQNVRNLGVVGMALASRAAIEGGLPFEEAFSLNDSQILKIEEMNSIGEIEIMIRRNMLQYAELVHDLKHSADKKKNPLVEECKNLIFRRMHSKIIVGELAKELKVSTEHLSALFRKTEGICIKDYIMKEKVHLAENLLIYSEYSIEQIGLYLGFSSQSHFGSIFKSYDGMTPKQYRDQYAAKDF